jgi:choline dehydrogenase-like flavoprotein
MHIDARELDDGSIIEGDICIVGAGAAGISIALDLEYSAGKVILLEGGGFEYDEDVQALYSGETTGQRYYPLQSTRLRMFGGTTGHWNGMCAPLDEIDFSTREWVPDSGWPISLQDLDPYYNRAQEILQLGPNEYSLEYWRDQDPGLVPLPLDKASVWNKLWQFSPPTRFGQQYRDRIVNSSNIHLYTHANLTDISANETISEIERVTVKSVSGKTHKVQARYVVLACGAIENARLLLASNRQNTDGLGNQNDLVGRYFMEHIEIKSGALWLTRPLPMELYLFVFGKTRVRAELAISPQKQHELRMVNGTASLMPLELGRNMDPLIDLWSNKDPRKSFDNLVANAMVAEQAENSELNMTRGRAFELYTRLEQSPNPDSRITLGRESDGLGVPKPILNWHLTDLERRSIRKIHDTIGQEIGRTGVGRLQLLEYLWDENDLSWPASTSGGWHHMGTTRMHDDPKKGVVDANCRVHGVNNLFVAGSSCFPTGGAANPTLTLTALSLRLSDHLKSISG